MPLVRALCLFFASFALVGAREGFFRDYCFQCHGPEKEKGDLRLDTLPPDSPDWGLVLRVLENGEMPPKN